MDDVLTIETLRELGACGSAQKAFYNRFGAEAKIEDVVDWLRKIRGENWGTWILGQELSVTKAFVGHGANVNADNGGALWWASHSGNVEVVKFLLDNGADIHAGNDDALIEASYGGRAEVVKLLLERGANVHADNDAALIEARRCGNNDVIELLEAAMAAADKKS
jgi:hypothetical protein